MVSKATFWNFFHALFWFIAIFCLWISGLNYEGLKYSRLSSSALPPAPFQQCSKLLVDLTHTDSWLCCDEGSQNVLWVCTAANDGITRFLSSSWAWVIPFIPTALTAAIDAIVGSFHPVRQQNGWGHRMQVCLFFVLVRSVSHQIRSSVTNLPVYFICASFSSLSFICCLTNWVSS